MSICEIAQSLGVIFVQFDEMEKLLGCGKTCGESGKLLTCGKTCGKLVYKIDTKLNVKRKGLTDKQKKRQAKPLDGTF